MAPEPQATTPIADADVVAPAASNGASDAIATLMRLTPQPEAGPPAAPTDVAERVARCIAVMEEATTYVSRQVVRDPNRTALGEGDFVWDVEFAKPDAFRVRQTGWSDSREVHDEWIAIGRDFYHHAGRWQKPEELGRFEGELRLNRHLTADKYMRLLRQGHPTSATERTEGSDSYLVVEYDPVGREALASILDNPSPPQSVHGVARVWIESGSGLIAKAEVEIEDRTGGPRLLFEQVFAAYNEPLRIERPVIDGPAASGELLRQA